MILLLTMFSQVERAFTAYRSGMLDTSEVGPFSDAKWGSTAEQYLKSATRLKGMTWRAIRNHMESLLTPEDYGLINDDPQVDEDDQRALMDDFADDSGEEETAGGHRYESEVIIKPYLCEFADPLIQEL